MATEKIIFSESLADGLLFLPRAQFKAASLQVNLREEEIVFPGTTFPTTSDIKAKVNSTLQRPFYENCIAFSITQNRRVIYKYQLFYEDLELVPTTQVIDKKVGVYIRSLDDFHKLIPFINNIGLRTYGAVGGNTQGRNYTQFMVNMNADKYRKVLDGAWSIMSWDIAADNIHAINVQRTGCGNNMGYSFQNSIFSQAPLPSRNIDQRAIFKSRRVSETGFELYVTSNNQLSDNWYWVVRKEGLNNRYWDVAGPGNPQGGVRTQFDPSLVDATRFLFNPNNINPVRQDPWRTQFSFENKEPFDLQLFPRDPVVADARTNISVPNLHFSTDCNICMLATDNPGNTCFGGHNNGPIWIIQPSLASIIENILDADDYNLALNLCVNAATQSTDVLIQPARYPLTSVFLSNQRKFIPRINACNEIRAAFCARNDPETKQSNLFTTTCKDFCSNEYNCTNLVTAFCNTQDDPLDNTNRQICGCSIRDVPKVKQVFDRFVTEYESKGLSFPNCNEPRYIFSPCRISDYGSSDNLTNRPPPNASVCGSNINCVSYVEIDNEGTINGNIDVGIDQKSCATIINAIQGNNVDCNDASDCKDEKENKFCINSKCAQCNTNSDCGTLTPKCNTNNVCVQCLQNSDCKGDTPACVGGICQQCATTADCGAGKKCAGNICVNDDTNKPTTTFNALYAGIGVLGLVLVLVLVLMVIRKRKKRL